MRAAIDAPAATDTECVQNPLGMSSGRSANIPAAVLTARDRSTDPPSATTARSTLATLPERPKYDELARCRIRAHSDGSDWSDDAISSALAFGSSSTTSTCVTADGRMGKRL